MILFVEKTRIHSLRDLQVLLSAPGWSFLSGNSGLHSKNQPQRGQFKSAVYG